jgi:hypothetical protein
MGRASARMAVGMGRAAGAVAGVVMPAMGWVGVVKMNRVMLAEAVAKMDGIGVGEVTG